MTATDKAIENIRDILQEAAESGMDCEEVCARIQSVVDECDPDKQKRLYRVSWLEDVDYAGNEYDRQELEVLAFSEEHAILEASTQAGECYDLFLSALLQSVVEVTKKEQ